MPNSGKTPKVSYLDNLAKETKQAVRSWTRSADLAGPSGYPEGPAKEAYKAKQAASGKAFDSAKGQFFGALLQGRRYDDKTGAQVKKSADLKMPQEGPLVKIVRNAKKASKK